MRVIASWSGGKDSCLALHKACAAGHEPVCLLNFLSKEFGRCCFHGIAADLMRAQAGCLGLGIVQPLVSQDMGAYEREFKEAVLRLKEEKGACGMIFGDVYLDEHRTWVERVCAEVGIEPIEPLWGMPADSVVREFIAAGFRSVVVSAKADLFGRDDVGRAFDTSFLDLLKERKICPCGENGEFHTFVMGGPGFRRSIEIDKSQAVLKKGFWEHWFLDIQEWEVKGA